MFFEYAIKRNRYFSAHIVLAAVLFLMIQPFYGNQIAFISVLAVGLLYEIWQYFTGKWKKVFVDPILEQKYGQLKQVTPEERDRWKKKLFLLDSYGDMIAAFLGNCLMLIAGYVL